MINMINISFNVFVSFSYFGIISMFIVPVIYIYIYNGSKCKNKETCLKCAEEHDTSKCETGKTTKCVNCCYSNSKYNTNYNINHEASDSGRCEIFKAKIKKDIDMTDYPLPPTLPTFIDKVGRTGTKNSRLFSHTNKETNTQTPITDSPSPVSLTPTDSTCNSAVSGILSMRQK